MEEKFGKKEDGWIDFFHDIQQTRRQTKLPRYSDSGMKNDDTTSAFCLERRWSALDWCRAPIKWKYILDGLLARASRMSIKSLCFLHRTAI